MIREPMTEEEIKRRIAAHNRLCEEKRFPLFAPSNGVCWSCRRQIFEIEDGTSLITGCPMCHRSYCD